MIFLLTLLLSFSAYADPTDPSDPESCSLALSPVSGEQVALPKKGLISFLPQPLRIYIAKRSPQFRGEQIERLKHEISELLPTEAFSFMAYMPQTSHSYLLGELPEIKNTKRKTNKLVVRHDELPNSRTTRDSYDLHIETWAKRLRTVHAKLKEIQVLEAIGPGEDPVSISPQTHMTLAVFYGFTYGFSKGVELGNTRAEGAWSESLFGGNTEYIEAATYHYRQAIQGFEQQGGSLAVINVAKFLLGKHAVNALSTYSKNGVYDFDGSKVPPDSKYYEYLTLAKQTLVPLAQELQSQMPPNTFNEFVFEVLNWKRKLETFETGNGSGMRRSSKIIGNLLVSILLAAPREWVVSQLTKNYSILERLVCDYRWATYDANIGTNNNSYLHSLQMAFGGNTIPSYEEVINTLIDYGGLTELTPLLTRRLSSRQN